MSPADAAEVARALHQTGAALLAVLGLLMGVALVLAVVDLLRWWRAGR